MSYLITTFAIEKYDYKIHDLYIVLDSKQYQVTVNKDELILLEGFVYDLKLARTLTLQELSIHLKKCRNTRTVLPDFLTGQYNIIYYNDNKIEVITDFAGMKSLYYHFGNKIYISNNIYSFINYGFEFDKTALFQSMVSILNIPLNTRSLLQDVMLLRGGEYICFDLISKFKSSYIDTMEMKNMQIDENEIIKLTELLQNNAAIYTEVFKKIVLPISAGVDSRITLSSFKKINKNFNLISYGEPDYIDNKIAKNIADYIGLPHTNISFKNHLFPTNEEFKTMISNGGDFFIGAWFSVLKHLKENVKYKDSVILLGDVLDTLRAKNVKSIRSRSKRVNYQIKSFFGKKITLEALNVETFATLQKDIYKIKIKELSVMYPEMFKKLEFDESEFFIKTNQDIDMFLDFLLQKFQPNKQANLEEAFYVSTWGAKTMAKQINTFKGDFESYVLMASRHIVKQILSFSPLDRFEDKLTHALLKTKKFDEYSHFPTAQIPFVAYKTSIHIKYLVWAFRSTLDQILIKAGRGRLVKHIEWLEYYKNKKNLELLTKLLEDVDEDLKVVPITLFNKRASGELWPLAEVDINIYSYLLKIRTKNDII